MGVGEIIEVYAEGMSVMARMFSLMYLGDFVSLYFAIIRGIDPTPVRLLIYLSARWQKNRKKFYKANIDMGNYFNGGGKMNNKNISGNSKTREDHKLIVLNFIRKTGLVFRTDIYEKTKISKPTVTRIIEEILKEGIVRETGVGEPSVGRKPVYIELNPSAYYCIGVNISRNTIRASMVDLGMNIISKRAVDIRQIKDALAFKSTVAGVIKELCSECRIDTEKILGIGIGAPGIVDFEKGVILDFAIGHKLMDIHLKEYLQ